MQADIKKRSDNRTTSTRKIIRYNNELLALIDEARGSESFSSWVQSACKKKLGEPNLPIEKSEK